ncbi:MAG TPA: hypothetical protein ENI17_16020 [Pseudomonas xinjiangensis]|uniref:Peptidase S8/S53 domain-containing protein n=1 Tax=Halopseudomonas xinjiangensis TaxID=487184 RepID=A0A7V1BM98_9GAMM|nr:hypothetical protein [Halopseudomonas xinjiangensis]HEC49109.1 hypothetical protein [Halopseudomonas xinjiangensis]
MPTREVPPPPPDTSPEPPPEDDIGPAPDPGPLPGADASARLTPLPAEYEFTGGYELTYGHVAHDRGFTGANNIIAQIDSGVRTSHVELQGQIAGSYNVLTGATTEEAGQDSGNHGTHVAGILVAKRNNFGSVGYAPGAQLLNVRFTNAANEITATDQQLANGFNWARTNGARWFNNSWGIETTADEFGRLGITTYFPALLAEWQAGAQQDKVYVWATGNQGDAQPLVFAALPSLFPELTYQWVAVTSVDASGQLSAFANACGDAAAWCLAAPGSDIISSVNVSDTTYASFSGTSMAAPAVTGALAVVSQAFPTLSSAQVVQRLFFTANKDGVYANESLYGQGLLDLELATRPVGTLMLVSDSGQPLSLESASLVLGAPFGYTNPLANLQVMATDSLAAGFAVDLGQQLSLRRYRYDTSLAFERLGRSWHSETDGLHTYTWTQRGGSSQGSRVLSFDQGAGSSLSMGQIDDLDLLENGRSLAGYSQLNATLAAPYWLQQPGEQTAGMRQRLPVGQATLELTSVANALRQGASLGLNVPVGSSYRSTLEVGFLRGRDGLFDSHGEGIFDLGNTSNTMFAGLRGQFSQGKLSLAHAAYLGQSEVDAAGLLANMGPVTTSSWLLAGRYSVQDNTWGLVLQQPLRVESATSKINLATGYAGNLFDMQSVSLNLAPDGRQVNLEAFWQQPLSPTSDVKISWLGIRQPGHQASASPMQVLMTQWQHRF